MILKTKSVAVDVTITPGLAIIVKSYDRWSTYQQIYHSHYLFRNRKIYLKRDSLPWIQISEIMRPYQRSLRCVSELPKYITEITYLHKIRMLCYFNDSFLTLELFSRHVLYYKTSSQTIQKGEISWYKWPFKFIF